MQLQVAEDPAVLADLEEGLRAVGGKQRQAHLEGVDGAAQAAGQALGSYEVVVVQGDDQARHGRLPGAG